MIDYIHTFFVGNNHEVQVRITNINGVWKAEPIKGKTGTGLMSGGNFKSLYDYIKEVEFSHNYSYNFFNHGYEYAKSKI